MRKLPNLEDLVAGSVLARQRRLSPERLALAYGDKQLTYAALDDIVNNTANGLAKLGVCKGSHVGLMMNNRPEFVISVYALAKLGAVCVPFNTTLFGKLLSYFVEDSEIAVIIAHSSHAETLAKLDAAQKAIRTWIAADPGGSAISVAGGLCTTLDEVQASGSKEPPGVTVRPSDPLVIMYTSGTTGPSKGVVSSHSHVQWVAAGNADRWLNLGPDDVFYSTMPLFHAGALWYCVGACFWVGAAVILKDRFSASRFWDDICELGATATMIPMTMSSVLEKAPPSERDRTNPLRIAWVSPLPVDVRRFEQRFGIKVATHFSMTEISPASVGMPGTVYDKPTGCAGRPTEEWDVIVADEFDRSVPAGNIGEILVRPRRPGIIFSGYHRKQQATVEAWRNLWFHTGDRGYFDKDGFLYFVDRAKDTIRRRGENISAYEIEKALVDYEGIREVAAVPVPSPLGEDDLCVYVTSDAGPSFQSEAFIHHAAEVLPYFMVPRYVGVVKELPRTPSGKVQKYILRQWAEKTESLWDREKHGIEIGRPHNNAPERKAEREPAKQE
jgi:crotonobetaine/carnitine-CoA ligase